MAAHLLAEKRKLLDAALRHVAFDGWSGKTLELAARDAGYDLSVARRAFPHGAAGLLEFWIAEADRQMLEDLEPLDLPAMKVRERIATAVRVRLERQAPHKEAVRRALALQALPNHAGGALASAWRTVDAIWHAADDTATDWNYYTKRALLAGVYSATVLYWLNDRSAGGEATWRFLDRRIGDVMRIQKVRGRLDELAGKLPDPFRLLRRRPERI